MAQIQAKLATIEDVARAAGVSRQTVSRAINGKGEIHPVTRQRILGVADRLGYQPSGIARSLATRTSSTIGLVVPDIANPFFPEIARGVEDAAYSAGYHVFLSNSAEDPGREWEIIRSLEGQRIAGLILCSSRLTDAQLVELAGRYYPLVLLNRQVVGAEVSSLLIDDYRGAILAMRFLLERGHRAIGLLSGPERSWSGNRRLEGYCQALSDSGLPSQDRWIMAGFPQVEGGRWATRPLLEGAPEITAILADNDLMALGALQACRETGRRTPDDCAIIGFDDIPLAALVAPPLTTVSVDKGEAGQRAMALLTRLLADGAAGATIDVLETHLVVRGST
jgi:LacI family transcriptional regulator